LKGFSGQAAPSRFYVFFNNHARAQAVENALMLRSELEPELQIKAPGRLIDAFPDLRGFAESSDAGQLELR